MYDCDMLCTPDLNTCNKATKDMIKETAKLAIALAEAYLTGEYDVAKIIASMGSTAALFANGICPAPSFDYLNWFGLQWKL